MSHLQGDGSSNSRRNQDVEREESMPGAAQNGERGLDGIENGLDVEIEEGRGEREQDRVTAVQNPTSTKIFGIVGRPNLTAKKGNDAYNYEEKYPEDAIYEEVSSNARVWRTYEDESRIHDANMVEESRDNVDVLLVFAGLFSAVVTTFVAQTYQNLQPDYTAMSASLLFELVLIQRAITNGSSVNAIAPSPLNPTIAFVPTTTDVWVNGLWFTSLFLSLTTALVAVLVKQRLHHYVALPSGTPRERSFTRQFRYAGFQRWHVQVIIGLLPVLMHLALAIFLSGLVIFLHPLQIALSWIMCTAAALVYASYALAAILPIIFPQCPYRTPLCDLIYVSFCRIIPQVSWNNKDYFLIACRRGELGHMFRYLPHVQARNRQSLTMMESKLVRRTSTNLAAGALYWLFSVSSNPTVQSIVVQSIGGLPMASEEKLLALRGNDTAMDTLRNTLLVRCFQTKVNDHLTDPVPGAELKLERLLRFLPRFTPTHSIVTPGIDTFELTAAILSNGYRYAKGGWFIRPITFFMEAISPTRVSMLPLHCWSHLVRATAWELDAFSPLDPDDDDHTNTFPLDLCSAILCSFHASQKGLTQDFNSPLILGFKDALPYFLDKIYDRVLLMLSRFDKDPLLGDASLRKSLRVFMVAIEFLLHRLSLPEPDKHTIHLSLTAAVGWIRDQTLSPQEATAVIAVLEDILAPCVIPPLDVVADWMTLFNDTILVYRALTIVPPSACSSRGLRFMIEFMSINWDYALDCIYQSDVACWVLTDLLAKRVPVAYAAFLENQCLQFIGNHTFREASSVPFVREYVAGIFAMQCGSDGVVDAAMLQQHIDYLHNPINLFTACSILAIHGLKDIDRTSIYKDITTLVRLCPRNVVWDERRSKLRDLVQNDGGDFFSKQLVWTNPEHMLRPLQPEEIQVEKDNIGYAIQVLDDFFDGGAHPMVPFDSSPARHTTGRRDCFVGWCLGRQPDGEPEQEQQV